MYRRIVLLCSILLTAAATAQVPPASKVAIPLQVSINRGSNPPQVTLRWKHDPDFLGADTVLVRQRQSDPQFLRAGIVAPTAPIRSNFRCR